MEMSKATELAEALNARAVDDLNFLRDAAAELRRLDSVNRELLGALKKLLPLAVDSKMRPEFDLDILYARAAIAKAEGE
jgi:hypothetical protein